MSPRYLVLGAVLVLAGCAAGADSGPAPLGYQYHDGNHIGGLAQYSPQAAYNATHGTWLWPPAESDRPE